MEISGTLSDSGDGLSPGWRSGGFCQPSATGEEILVSRLMSVALVVGLVLAIPSAAMASVEKHEDQFDIVFGDPLGAELCGVDEFITHLSGTQKVTEFFDKDGDLVKVHVNVTATAEVTGDGELLAWDNYAFEIIYDLEEGTESDVGSPFNTHVTGAGVVINASGKIVVSLADGSLLEGKGPHEVFFTPPAVFICEAING